MKAGAFDFIEKPLQQELLLESVDRALRWDTATRDERLELTTLKARAAALTAREREILDLVATGEPNKIIARRLGISFRTVEQHRSRILERDACNWAEILYSTRGHRRRDRGLALLHQAVLASLGRVRHSLSSEAAERVIAGRRDRRHVLPGHRYHP
jgi:hypothetical protein